MIMKGIPEDGKIQLHMNNTTKRLDYYLPYLGQIFNENK